MKKIIAFLLLTAPLLAFAQNKASPLNWKVATYNLRQFGADQSPKEPQVLLTILKNMKADLLAVQEVVDTAKLDILVKRGLPNHKLIINECGGSGRQKLGFIYNKRKFRLSSWKEDFRVKDPGKTCHQGLRPAVLAEFEEKSSGRKFVAISLHLKAGGRSAHIQKRAQQYKRLQVILKDLRKNGMNRIILMGDLNTTEYLSRNEHYQRFVDFVDQSKMIDLAKDLDCTSYWDGKRNDGHLEGSLLDHILISRELAQNIRSQKTTVHAHCSVLKCKIEREGSLGLSFDAVSDHCPVLSRIK